MASRQDRPSAAEQKAAAHAFIFEQLLCFETPRKDKPLCFVTRDDSFLWDGEDEDPDDILLRIWGLRDDLLDKAVRLAMVQARGAGRAALKENRQAWATAHEGGDPRALWQMVNAISHPETGRMDLICNFHAMAQVIWQTKRRALGREANNQILPIFWSTTQRSGKNQFIDLFTKCLAAHRRESYSVEEFKDQFGSARMATSLIACIDELDASRVPIATLKSAITAKVWDKRAMFRSKNPPFPNITTFIGSSNLPPPHGLIDTTAGRRFWSIRFHEKEAVDNQGLRDALPLDGKGGIDLDAVWSWPSVNIPCYYETIPADVRAYMNARRDENFREKPAEESAIEELYVKTGIKEATIPFGTLKDDLKRWAAECNVTLRSLNKKPLFSRLQAVGIDCSRTDNVYKLVGYRHLTKEELENDGGRKPPGHLLPLQRSGEKKT